MINKLVANTLPHMPKKLIWLFSKRYIAGVEMKDAINVSEKLNSNKVKVTIDLLGEFIKDLSEAEANKITYLQIIDEFIAQKIDGNFSLKPSMFGLLLDKEICFNHIREIVAHAAKHGSFVRIDMEDSQCVDDEINIYKRLYKEFPNNVGLVMQAYLRRTKNDLQNFLDFAGEENTLNFRLCKGIYIEPKSISFKDRQEVREHYLEDLEFLLTNKIYVGIATHDKYLVEKAFELIEKHNISKEKYEFQMLYGITPSLRKMIVEKGHKMRVYVPYGEEWFSYSTRRLKENPKMAQHIIKAFFVRG